MSDGEQCRGGRDREDPIDSRGAAVVPGEQARPVPGPGRTLMGPGVDGNLSEPLPDPEHSACGQRSAAYQQQQRDPGGHSHEGHRLWNSPRSRYWAIVWRLPGAAGRLPAGGHDWAWRCCLTQCVSAGGGGHGRPSRPDRIFPGRRLRSERRPTSSKDGLGGVAWHKNALAPRVGKWEVLTGRQWVRVSQPIALGGRRRAGQ